tara:strand:- start:675 stop:899 length:225 start_codon:yes stop_codon:yes gene_type:complete
MLCAMIALIQLYQETNDFQGSGGTNATQFFCPNQLTLYRHTDFGYTMPMGLVCCCFCNSCVDGEKGIPVKNNNK